MEVFDVSEICVNILIELSVKDIVAFCSTCKDYLKYLNDNYLWNLLLNRDWSWKIKSQIDRSNYLSVYQRLFKNNICSHSIFCREIRRTVITLTWKQCYNRTINSNMKCTNHVDNELTIVDTDYELIKQEDGTYTLYIKNGDQSPTVETPETPDPIIEQIKNRKRRTKKDSFNKDMERCQRAENKYRQKR